MKQLTRKVNESSMVSVTLTNVEESTGEVPQGIRGIGEMLQRWPLKARSGLRSLKNFSAELSEGIGFPHPSIT